MEDGRKDREKNLSYETQARDCYTKKRSIPHPAQKAFRTRKTHVAELPSAPQTSKPYRRHHALLAWEKHRITHVECRREKNTQPCAYVVERVKYLSAVWPTAERWVLNFANDTNSVT